MNDNTPPDYKALLRDALGELEDLALDAARARQMLDNPALEASQVLYDAYTAALEAVARLQGQIPDEMEPAF